MSATHPAPWNIRPCGHWPNTFSIVDANGKLVACNIRDIETAEEMVARAS